jgi:hypothetical protein
MNRIQKIIGFVTTLVGLAAVFLYFTGQWMIFDQVRTWATFTNPDDPLAKSGLTITGQRLTGNRAFAPGYREMAQAEDIEANRFVTVHTFVPVRQMLRAGEEAPAPGQEELFVKSRAVHVASEECELMLSTMARQCEVHRTHAQVKNGMAMLVMYLRFVQKAPQGTPDASRRWHYQQVTNELFDRDEKVSVGADKAKRRIAYQRAHRECGAIRRREGNCAITSMRLSTATPRQPSGRVHFNASAAYGFLADLGALPADPDS